MSLKISFACIFHSTSLWVIYLWMFVSVFYWKSGSDAGWSETLCSDKSVCDSIVQPKRWEIDWWELIQFTGWSVWENSKERKRKSVGLRHSGRCHGASHGISHTHTVSSLCMLFRPTQSHTLQCHSHSVSNQTAQAIGKHTAILDCLKIELFFYTGCFSSLFDEMMSKQLLQYAGAYIKNICTTISSSALNLIGWAAFQEWLFTVCIMDCLSISGGNFQWL